MAPELIDCIDYGKGIDMWMLGIFLYEIIHGFSPFRPKKEKFKEIDVIHCIQDHNIIFYKPVTDNCKELILSLLEIDPNKRCKIDDIYNSKFVKSFEKNDNGISYLSYLKKNEDETFEIN